jgi:hypothetical protein
MCLFCLREGISVLGFMRICCDQPLKRNYVFDTDTGTDGNEIKE